MPILESAEEEILSENASYEGKKGLLTLTSKRIIFESQSGLYYKKTYSNFELPVSIIEKIEVGGFKGRNICIKMKKGFAPIRFEITVLDANKWFTKIQETIQAPEERVFPEKKESGKLLRQRCPVCGAPMIFFDENEHVVCKYCQNLTDLTQNNERFRTCAEFGKTLKLNLKDPRMHF